MSYQTRAKRERAKWMTIGEAARHIQVVDCTDQAGALSQLRTAFVDREIPLRWAADPPPLEGDWLWDPWPFSSDEVPNDPLFWFNALIFLDGDGLVVERGPRQLLLLRSRVFELWPQSNHERKDRASTTQPEKLPRRGVGEDEIRSAARDIYREINRPNKDISERLVRQRLRGGKRDDIRRILDEDEFANVRRKAGNQPKNPNLRNS
jgi:hypothetical protein